MRTSVKLALGLLRRGRGFDYYVDSINGDDGNDGASPETALKTIGALPALQPGDRIGLARGSHWREQLTITVDNVTVEAYGTGDKPLLDCSTVYANASFSKTDGRTNIYQIAITTNYVSGEPSFVGVWEDDTRFVSVASLDLCDSTPGSYYVASHNAVNITLYVHASDSSDITGNGKTYEVADRGFGVYAAGRSHITLRGLHCRRNYSNGGSIKVGRYARIYDCLVEDGNSHSLYVSDGSLCDGVWSRRAYHTSSLSHFVYHEQSPIGAGVVFRNCRIDNDGVYYHLGNAIYGHNSVAGTFGTVLIENCIVSDIGVAVSGINATHIIRNCTFTNCGYAVRPYVDTHISGCTFSTTERTISFLADDAAVTITDTEMVLPVATNGFIYSNLSNNAVTMSNCTLTKTSGAYFVYIVTGTGIRLDVQHCTFVGAAANVYRVDQTGNAITSDYNEFTATSGWRLEGDTYTFAEWQALGYDTHSTHD